MQETIPNILLQFVPLLIFSSMGGFVAHALAKDKGRDVILWTVLGFIPIVNMFCLPFFIGAANLKLEKKIDAILEAMAKNVSS
jgi:hypothetical protein